MTVNLNVKEIVKEIKDRVFDEHFIEKYGTSVMPNMGLQYEEHLREKYKVLILEFARVDKNSNSIISIQELAEFLTSYEEETGKKFDEGYVKRLFRLIDVNSDEQITA